MTNLSLTYSFWWVFVCLIVGGVYAWIQYTKPAPWPKQLNYTLAALRAILVALICFFLVEPYIQSITNYFQKPLMVIAVDNSESMRLNTAETKIAGLKLGISEVKKELIDKGFDVNILDLEANVIDNIDSITFNNPSTDLSYQLNKIKGEYSNFNLAGTVLFSDGIFNKGYTPLAISTNYPIYTVGVGDTSKIKDVAISEIKHNSTVFEGNSLLLEVLVLHTGIKGGFTEISVRKKGKVVARESIELIPTQSLVKTIVPIPISGSGKQSLTINLKPIEGEFTELNNRQTIYFDVIDAQKRILLVASAPHPDLKAIKSSIEQSEYYKVDLVYELPKKLDYDLIIAHQYPSIKTSVNNRKLLISSVAPKWFIIGTASDFKFLGNGLKLLKSYNATGKVDFVKPVLNANFDKFQISGSFSEWISDLPPIAVPYGMVSNNLLADDFLNRQIGSVVTKQPLLFFTNFNGQRLGVLFGSNFWRWRLDEFRTNQTHTHFDALISKTVQYLSSNVNKKRFYVNPQKDLYEKGEDVLFKAEEYNALFERVVGKKVNLKLTNENGDISNYSFVPLSETSVYKISGLPKGVYSFNASAEIESKKYYSTGQFIVQQLNKEALNPVADFDLLRKLANKSQASFYELGRIDELKSHIETLNPISTIHTTEKDEPLLHLKWVLILLILLATMEWFLRKFYGGY